MNVMRTNMMVRWDILGKRMAYTDDHDSGCGGDGGPNNEAINMASHG